MKKSFFASALLFAALCAASTKQYTVTFVTPVQVGSVKLAPGEYKVKVDGANAVFTDSHKKSFTAPAKVEKVDKKSPFTAAETKEVNGSEQLNIIDIDGADFKLVF
jgi:hypothetical protein